MNQAMFTTKLGLAAGAALLMLATAAEAQPRDVPPGSYLETCRHAEVHRGMLMADCLRVDGTVNRSAIDLDHCHGPIANLDGRLVCHHRHDDRGPPPPPPYGR